jgi:hypothetical protein
VDWNQHQSLAEFREARDRLAASHTEGRSYLEQARQRAPWAVQVLREAGRLLEPRNQDEDEDEDLNPDRIRLLDGIPAIGQMEPSDDPGTLPESNTGRQRYFTAVVERASFLRRALGNIRPPDRDRIMSAAGPFAGAFLNTFPKKTTIDNHWAPGRLRTAMQLRCGLPITIISNRPRVEYCTCTRRTPLLPDGRHCLAGNCNRYYLVSQRHNMVSAALAKALRYAQVPCKIEQRSHLREADAGRLTIGICDIKTDPWPTQHGQGHPVAIDVTVVQPEETAALPGAGAAEAERGKEELYQQPIDHATEFVPFALEHFGRPGQQALQFVDRISTLPTVFRGLQDQGYRTHDPRTGKPYRIIVNMYKTWIMQRISTALMQGMAACIHERLHRIHRDRTAPEFRDLPHINLDGFGRN